MKFKHFIAALLLITAINFTPDIVHAQDNNPPTDGDGDGTVWQGDPDDTPVPFDGGISILVAAGVAYGLKKRHDFKTSRIQE